VNKFVYTDSRILKAILGRTRKKLISSDAKNISSVFITFFFSYNFLEVVVGKSCM